MISNKYETTAYTIVLSIIIKFTKHLVKQIFCLDLHVLIKFLNLKVPVWNQPVCWWKPSSRNLGGAAQKHNSPGEAVPRQPPNQHREYANLWDKASQADSGVFW